MLPSLGICLAILLHGTTPPAAQAPPTPPTVAISGRVVDDQTGLPIESFDLEHGRVEGPGPERVSWGGSSRSVPNTYTHVDGKAVRVRLGPPGEFSDSLEVGGAGARRQWLRVLADGYEPRPVTDRPPTASDAGTTIRVEVRLRRGRTLVGRVVDHAGRPAAGARLFLIRPAGMAIRVVGGVIGEGSDVGLLDPGLTRAVADPQGRFRLAGVGDATAIGVSAASVHLWKVPIPGEGGEVTLRLPRPGTIRLPYAIEGDEAEAEFQLYLGDPDGPDGRLSVRRDVRVRNGGEAVLGDATPGEYTLWRRKTVVHGAYRQSVGVERRRVVVKGGEATRVEFVRGRGGPIRGRVVGPEGDVARMSFVAIEAIEGPGAGIPGDLPRRLDIVACGEDGRFRTARIPPGRYVVRAVGYRTRPRYGPFVPVMEIVDFVGDSAAFVDAEGGAEEVRIKLASPGHGEAPAEAESAPPAEPVV